MKKLIGRFILYSFINTLLLWGLYVLVVALASYILWDFEVFMQSVSAWGVLRFISLVSVALAAFIVYEQMLTEARRKHRK